MAISLDELAAVALEGSVGPVTLAVGAGALAVALAAGSARPLRRMATTSLLAAEWTGQFRPVGWLGAAKERWRGLVAEAREEYEASRRPAASGAAASIVVSNAAGVVPEAGTGVVVHESSDAQEIVDLQVPGRTRDRRGRFVRPATNGFQPE